MTYEYDFKSGRLRKRKGSSSGQAGSSSLVDRYFRGPFLDGEEDKSWIPESSVMPNKDGDGERASAASSHRYGLPAAEAEVEAEAEAEEYYRVRSERTAAGRAADYQQITTARENRRRDSPRRQKSV